MFFKYSLYLLYISLHLTKSSSLKVLLSRDSGHLILTIVGGVEAEINKYPYNAKYGSTCGAVIIDEKWAMTAAHCGRYNNILVGSKFSNGGKSVSVKNIYNHPKWASNQNDHQYDYDYRLLELNESLDFHNPNVQPLKLARPGDMFIGKNLTVTGWGNTKENGASSRTLQAVEVPIASKLICQFSKYYYGSTLTPRMFCAGARDKDACQGDSGGPAAADGRLFGTVSFGVGCATPGSFGVYSKVADVRDWIAYVTKLNLD